MWPRYRVWPVPFQPGIGDIIDVTGRPCGKVCIVQWWEQPGDVFLGPLEDAIVAECDDVNDKSEIYVCYNDNGLMKSLDNPLDDCDLSACNTLIIRGHGSRMSPVIGPSTGATEHFKGPDSFTNCPAVVEGQVILEPCHQGNEDNIKYWLPVFPPNTPVFAWPGETNIREGTIRHYYWTTHPDLFTWQPDVEE